MKAANDPNEILDRLPEPYRTMVLALPSELRAKLVAEMPDSIRAAVEAASAPAVIRAVEVDVRSPGDADPDKQGFPVGARVVLRSRGDLPPSFTIEVRQTDGMGELTWHTLPNFDRMGRSVDEVLAQALARHGLVVLALAERVAELEDALAKGDA